MKTSETKKLCEKCKDQIPHKCPIDGKQRGWHTTSFTFAKRNEDSSTMNKASMINEICCGVNLRYLPSMYRMSYQEVQELYGALFRIGVELQEIKGLINKRGTV